MVSLSLRLDEARRLLKLAAPQQRGLRKVVLNTKTGRRTYWIGKPRGKTMQKSKPKAENSYGIDRKRITDALRESQKSFEPVPLGLRGDVFAIKGKLSDLDKQVLIDEAVGEYSISKKTKKIMSMEPGIDEAEAYGLASYLSEEYKTIHSVIRGNLFIRPSDDYVSESRYYQSILKDKERSAAKLQSGEIDEEEYKAYQRLLESIDRSLPRVAETVEREKNKFRIESKSRQKSTYSEEMSLEEPLSDKIFNKSGWTGSIRHNALRAKAAEQALEKLPPLSPESLKESFSKMTQDDAPSIDSLRGDDWDYWRDRQDGTVDGEGYLRRMLNTSDIEALVSRYEEGDIVIDSGFTSSYVPVQNHETIMSEWRRDANVEFFIDWKKDGSSRGKYVDHFKSAMVELEVLFPPNTPFRVERVDDSEEKFYLGSDFPEVDLISEMFGVEDTQPKRYMGSDRYVKIFLKEL